MFKSSLTYFVFFDLSAFKQCIYKLDIGLR